MLTAKMGATKEFVESEIVAITSFANIATIYDEIYARFHINYICFNFYLKGRKKREYELGDPSRFLTSLCIKCLSKVLGEGYLLQIICTLK